MIIHCNINRKPLLKSKKFLNVEFINNGGYWAKWYEAKTTEEAKELFKKEYPNGKYLRSKNSKN